MRAATESAGGTGSATAVPARPEAPRALPAWLSGLARSEGTGKPMGYLGRHSRSFRYAARFLPGPKALEVAEVYAFCRFTDDIVDAASAPADLLAARLDEWQELAARAYGGEHLGLPLLDRPMRTMAERGVPFDYVESLVDGMRMDLRPRRYRDGEELSLYTYRVAAVVGRWLTELCGVRNPWVLARAADLGHAMQLTNILRDVGEDWRRGRLYLPLDLLARHGLDPEEVGRGWDWGGRVPAAWRDLTEDLMATAEDLYRRAFQGIPHLPGYFQRPVLVSALVYREIHAALRRNGYDNFRLRAASSQADKVALGIKAWWILPSLRTLYRPGMPLPSPAAPAPGALLAATARTAQG